MIIDIFAHHISNSVGQIISRKEYYGESGNKEFIYPGQNAIAEERLALMEKYGVDIQVLSQTTPVLLGFNPGESAEICSMSNDDNYKLCREYPDRFVNICIVSLLDVRKAVQEIERSVNELDCRGITVSTNHNGTGLDSPEYMPFYEKLAEYDLPLLLQPTHWDSYPLVDMKSAWGMMLVFGWPFDTTQAIWRMIYGGVFDRFPSLKLVTHHCGAMIPFFASRAEKISAAGSYGKLPRPLPSYWQNIYGDTVLNGNVAALDCGYSFFGPDRMLYGSDYPFSDKFGEYCIKDNLLAVKAMNIPDHEKRKILGTNAQNLLKIKSASR